MAIPYCGKYEYDVRNTVTTDLGFKLKILDVSIPYCGLDCGMRNEAAFDVFLYEKTCDPVEALVTDGKTTEETGSDAASLPDVSTLKVRLIPGIRIPVA